jgi:hypothetical protein
MNYEQFCENSKALIAEAKKYDNWRVRSKARLLTDLAPRIGKLGTQMYMGCGFHYSLERQLGNLITELSMPVQWCANHCEKIPEDRLRLIGLQVSMMMLTQSVVEAEKSRSKLLKTNQI